MATSIPALGAVGIRKEASFASGGAIDNWQVIDSANLAKTNVSVYQDRIRNSPEQIAGRFSHSLVSGPITFPVSPSNPQQWWACGIGGSGPYTPQRPLSSMMIEIQEGQVSTLLSSGDMIDRLQLSSKQGDILRCSVNIEAKDMDPRSASAVTYPSGDDPYLHSEATFTLDGVVNNQVTAFDVTVNNNLMKDLLANNVARRDIPATKTLVTGSISLLFENTTFRDRFMNNSPSSIVAQYARGTKSFKIELNRINYDGDPKPLSSQSTYIVETLPFTAYVDDPTSQNSIKVTIV